MSISHDSKFTFSCDRLHRDQVTLVIDAKTERTAIAKARAANWDVLRVRAVSGVPKHKVARTVRRVFCPHCAGSVGVGF
jgi:hypothetical protein